MGVRMHEMEIQGDLEIIIFNNPFSFLTYSLRCPNNCLAINFIFRPSILVFT